jgi:hypothetical protein
MGPIGPILPSPLFLYQAESFVVAAFAKLAAAKQARHFGAKRFHPGNHGAATGAEIGVFALHHPARQRQAVGAFLIQKSQVPACLFPFPSMRGDFAATDSEFREQMGKLMTQCPVDLFVAELDQPGIENHLALRIIGAPCRGLQPGIPVDANPFGQFVTADPVQETAGNLFQAGFAWQSVRFTTRSRGLEAGARPGGSLRGALACGDFAGSDPVYEFKEKLFHP